MPSLKRKMQGHSVGAKNNSVVIRTRIHPTKLLYIVKKTVRKHMKNVLKSGKLPPLLIILTSQSKWKITFIGKYFLTLVSQAASEDTACLLQFCRRLASK